MKRLITILPILLLAFSAFGQTDPKENFYDGEFFFMEEEYSEALYAFNKVYKAGFQDNANINYRIGVCLLNIRDRESEAIPYLLKSLEHLSETYKEGNFNEVNAPYDAVLYLGNAYRINYELENAITYYNKYKELLNPKKNIREREYTDQQIKACQYAKEQLSHPVKYEAGILGQMNETNYAISMAVVSGDLKTSAFMVPQKFYDAIYYTKKIDDKWIKPLNITPTLQSDGDQVVVGLNFDGTSMLLAWSDEFDSEIYVSNFVNGYWTRSKPVGSPVNSKYFESHACYTPDGKSIYFTSNRKESLGGMDIFRCDYMANGDLSEPILLGTNVNTPLNEETPFVSPDGKRLYFSSQGHESMGGYDIFYCELQDDGTWGTPVNLGYPLNTTADDFSFLPNEIHKPGYLTMYAKSDAGQKDLYRFEYIPANATPVIVAFDEPVEEEIVAELEPDQSEITEEVVELAVDEAADEVAVVVEEEKPVVIAPQPVKKFVIQPLFFDFDKSTLTENSVEKLNNLILAMEEYPDLKLRIIGHTDDIGDESYNLRLSKSRAEAAAAYLYGKGIGKDRVSVAASGELYPAAINRTADGKDSPRGRQLNRRVIFEISLKDGIVKVDDVQVPAELKIN